MKNALSERTRLIRLPPGNASPQAPMKSLPPDGQVELMSQSQPRVGRDRFVGVFELERQDVLVYHGLQFVGED